MLKNSHRSLGLSMTPLLLVDYGDSFNNFNHFLIQTFQTTENIIFTSLFLLFYAIGTTFPDQDMKLKYLMPKYKRNERFRYHRQLTHSILLSAGSFYYIVFMFKGLFIVKIIALGMILGIFTHQIGDMLTGSIPWLLYGPYYIRFSRIGITVFLPKVAHKIFTEKLPKLLNRKLFIIYILFPTISCLIYIFKVPTLF